MENKTEDRGMPDKGERVLEKENNEVVEESVPLWKGVWTAKKDQ